MNKQEIKYKATQDMEIFNIRKDKTYSEDFLLGYFTGVSLNVLINQKIFDRVEAKKIIKVGRNLAGYTLTKYINGDQVLWDAHEELIVEKALNREGEEETIWRDEEIEAIKKLDIEFEKENGWDFHKFLDRKKGEPKQ